MKPITLGRLRARIVRDGDAPPTLVVVLLHGFGAPGDDLVSLAEWLDLPGVAWVFPEAPMELGGLYGDSRAWWMIDLQRLDRDLQRGVHSDRSSEVPDGMAEARAMVVELLDAVRAELGVADDRVVLGGFSQGAMLTLDVVLRTDRAFAGAILMSGTLLARHEWEPLMARRRGLRAIQSHGSRDAMLPWSAAETLRDLLAAAGWRLDWIPFEGGHEIPPPLLEELAGFLEGL
jgi:phospholipase/carboxylesterase